MGFQKAVLIDISESKLDSEFWERLAGSISEKIFLVKDDSKLLSHLANADCLLVNFGVTVDKSVIDSAPLLKYVGVLATTYGKIDATYCKTKGIVVSNIPGYSTEGVAEFVFGAVLEHCREIERAKSQARTGNYSEAGFSGTELKDKTFGVLGAGRIGARVAELAKAFGAKVKYWSRERKPDLETNGITYAELSELLSTSDFLSMHLAQTKETEGFLNNGRIQQLKTGAVVINTAPMELVDLDALEERLKENDLTFILDHSDELAQPDLKRLRKYSNCILYPPIAYTTKEARLAKQEIFVKNLENFLNDTPSNQV